MKRILFVDDEPQMLSGLQRLLRPQRHEWDMTFAAGGEQALVALAETPCDVIVTDMRMPGMDGVTLLEQVKTQWPQMVRIVLSGYTELEATLRTVPVAHQFLTKPCDPDRLKEVVERACALQSLLGGDALRATIAQMGDLPSQPGVYLALAEALADPATSMADVARLVEQDIAMSAKCLQLVNSAFFGLGRRVTSVQQAVSYLGTDMLKALVFTVEVFHAFQPAGAAGGFDLEALQRHSLLVARLATKLLAGRQPADDAFVAGMLHDVGKLVLVTRLPEQAAAIAAGAAQTGRPWHVMEEEVLGVTHAEIGAYLLGLWGLPQQTVEALAYHHTPARLPRNEFDVLAAVYVADVLIDEQTVAQGLGAAELSGPLDEEFLGALGVAEQVPAWRALAAELIQATLEGS
ncbi:MAG TPA: response regulator [Chloroflexota bacterium]|nr:response regulator [Chloroflexota bacterium]